MSAYDVQPVEISYFDIFYAKLERNKARNIELAKRRIANRANRKYHDKIRVQREINRKETIERLKTKATV